MAPITVSQKSSDSINSQKANNTLKVSPKKKYWKTLGRRAFICGLALYMPLAATLPGCAESSKEKRDKITGQLSHQPVYSEKITSIFKALRNYNYYQDLPYKFFRTPIVSIYDAYEPYQIDDAVGYASGWCMILQSPGINERVFSSSSVYQPISIRDLSVIIGPSLTNPTLGIFNVLPEGLKGLTYKGHIFGNAQVTAIASTLDQLGYDYKLFFRDGWTAELAFVLSDNIIITVKDPYLPLYRSGEFSDPAKQLSFKKIINFIAEKGLSAFILYAISEGVAPSMAAGVASTVYFCLAWGVYTWVDNFIENTKASSRANDRYSTEELNELKKYARITTDSSSYQFSKGQVSIFLLGRTDGESLYQMVREETFIKRKLTQGNVFGVCQHSPNEDKDSYSVPGAISWFEEEQYESIKRTLDKNGISYSIMSYSNKPKNSKETYHLAFILDTPNKVVLALNSYFRGVPLW